VKRRLLFWGVILLVIFGTFLVGTLFSRYRNRDFTLAFAGFNDTKGQTEALFWTTNGQVAAVNQIQEISRRVGGAWIKETTGPLSVYETIPYTDPIGADFCDAPHLVQLIGVPVTHTNCPLRLVIRCRERSPGLAGVRDRLQNFYYNRIKGLSIAILRGRDYCVTNEVPAIMPHTTAHMPNRAALDDGRAFCYVSGVTLARRE
jgi:hypothetical protein